jgi:periplasmic divalent cation tolerance protein
VISLVTDFIVVLVTAKDKEQAEKISQTLLAEKLVACSNIISPISSLFLWKDKVDRAEECILIMKTRKSLFGELQLCVKALHSYEVPEILALPIVEGSENYLSWMGSVLRQ